MPGADAPLDLLVIDAVAARHGIYRELLGGLAGQVVTVVPGEEARRRLHAGDFAAVAVHIDGVGDNDAAAKIAAEATSAGPPVVVISSDRPDLDGARGLFPGAVDYVPAPLAAELLPARISCLLELARLREDLAQRDAHIDALARKVAQMSEAVAAEQRASDVLRGRVGEQIHRSKNLLAIMQSVARRTFCDGCDISEARESLMGRLRALARAYHLVTAADGQGTEISDVVDSELAEIADRVMASGPSARLTGSVVQTFALAIHELRANAVKHGALRSPGGSVVLGWTFFEHGPDRYLEVDWTERGGAPPTVPSQYGFGLTLVSSFSGAGDARPNITFDPDGLACRMRLSQDMIVAT